LQISVPLVMEHVPGPLYAGLMFQTMAVPDGSGSLSVADDAVAAPLLFTVSVYPMGDPAVTAAASAVFARFKAGHCTLVVADACTEPLLPALAVAVLAYAAQLDAEVLLVTCTVAPAPGARLPKLQLSVSFAIVQEPGPLYAGLMLQSIPVPVGNGSFNVADVAAAAPLLLTASVKPIAAPDETVAASAVFVRFSAGHWTVVVADACTGLLLPALNVALLV
jgi:hypothetical protein